MSEQQVEWLWAVCDGYGPRIGYRPCLIGNWAENWLRAVYDWLWNSGVGQSVLSWLAAFGKMGFMGKGGKEPMVYVSREGCVV
ncbi:hypothetical protein F2Q69_00013924 [Brassica cretica]|uniref:Uncharacterized protein n=1 Tax=Brassica cretica TaxID=69181 RepID=A0A8S9R1Q4_BRACR|nr:hypothetical protein F2Q69_00013924 [Brassica cretica]